jgi:hypothetical protein
VNQRVVMIFIIILVVASVFSKYNILNTIIAHEQWMGDCQLKAIEYTENVITTTFLAVVTIFVVSTPLLPFKMTYAANTLSAPILLRRLIFFCKIRCISALNGVLETRLIQKFSLNGVIIQFQSG